MFWSKLTGGEAAVELSAADVEPPHAKVIARLDLDAPRSGRGWCRIAAHEASSLPLPEAPDGPPRVVLRSSRPLSVAVLRGTETLLDAAPSPEPADAVEFPCGALRGDERVVAIDLDGREPPRSWQLPALMPRLDILLPDGTSEAVELWCIAIDVDLDRGKLAVFWRASAILPRRFRVLHEGELRVRGGFVPGATAANLAQDLTRPPRLPSCALPIHNATRFEATTFPWQLVPQKDAEIVVVKATFDLVAGGSARLAEQQEPLCGERFHEGGLSLAYPGDFVPYKPRADVLVQGHAHAKPGAAVARVELRLGSISASLVAMGPRRWMPGEHPSEPAPFERVPLRYEHAFGGPGVADNPAGTGLAQGSLPPSIEVAGALLRQRGDRPAPAGFGPLARDWVPRKALLGTFTKEWIASRWPYLPDDFDPAFWNAAPAALTAEVLRGDEDFRITSVREGGANLEGRLPGLRPRCVAERAGHELSEVPLRLDTVLLDADSGRAVLVWRGAVQTTADRSAVRRLVLLSEPIDSPLSNAEIQHTIEVGHATAPPEDAASSAVAQEISTAISAGLAARRPLPRATSKLGALPSPVAAAIFGVKEAPRTSRSQVERWLAAGEGLAGRDLSGADLSGMDLSGQDMSRAILRGTILDDAKLDGVRAEGLRAAGLIARRSSWTGAKLARADFAGARLGEADLSGATLEQASFADAELSKVVARRAIATSAQFVRARMMDAVLEEASLQKADFSGATLDGVRLAGAQLDDAKFYEVLGECLVADRASMVDARFEAAQLDRASFRAVHGRGSAWERASLTGADFTSAELPDAGFAGANLTGARLTGADLTGARLRAAVLEGASFARANLMRANLEGAAAAGADFTGANLYQAETWRARMGGAKLAGAFVKGTKLG